MLKEQIIKNIVPKRYKKLTALQIAEYFEKLSPENKSIATEALLKKDNTIAIEKIQEYMESELDPIISGYITMGSIPTTIVEELLNVNT